MPSQQSGGAGRSQRISLRERQKASTRSTILKTAARLFNANGFDQTSVRDVAAEAGIGVGTMFAHFADKKTLLVETVIDDMDLQFQQIAESIPADTTLMEKLLYLAEEDFKSWLARPGLSRVLLRELYFTPGAAQDRLRALDGKAVMLAARLFSQAQDNGEIRPDVDPSVAARGCFAFYLSTVLIGLDGTSSDDQSELDQKAVNELVHKMVSETREYLTYIFSGIASSPGTHSSLTADKDGEGNGHD